MRFRTLRLFVLLFLVPAVATAQFIKPKILRGGDDLESSFAAPWKATWIGTGGKAAVEGLDDQAIPVSGEDMKLDLKSLDAPAVVFANPIGAKKGSLMYKFNVNGDWISTCIAPSDPWAWAQIDVSGCDTLMVWVKGATGTETWSFKMKAGEAEGGDIKVAGYLPEKKITTAWQEAIIPMKDLINMSKADLTKFASLCGGIGGEGDCTLYIDNLIFFKSKAAPEQAAPEQAAPEQAAPEQAAPEQVPAPAE